MRHKRVVLAYIHAQRINDFLRLEVFYKPEQADNVELLYQFKQRLMWDVAASLYYNHIDDYITQVALFEEDILRMTYVNVSHQHKAGLNVGVTVNPLKWMMLVLGANTYYVHSMAKEYSLGDLSNYGWVNSSNLKLQFRPIKGMNPF